jgi:hypothetical protein
MYEIAGVYGQIINLGRVSRHKKTFKIQLSTERGVTAFIEDQRPFETISIKDPVTKKDYTEYFMG